ncbi:CBS domain-containing protein [soil metagenome]
MRVRELLRQKSSEVITVKPEAPLRTATRLLMEHNVGGLPVVDERGAVVGFISERDVVWAVDSTTDAVAEMPVDRVMRKPAPTCDADASLQQVMGSMTRERQRHFVITESGRLLGVLSVGDLVKHRLQQLETETGVLRDYVAAQRAYP